MNRRTRATAPVLLALGIVAAAAPAAVSAASPIVVNSSGNQADLDSGAGICDADAAAGEQCTLRAALQTANAQPGADTITFVFSGTAPVIINVPSALPTITETLTIDGYSTAGTSVNTKAKGTNAKLRIVLKGPGDDAFDGLVADAPTEVSGLVLQRFRRGMLFIENASGSHIWGNFVGTNADGTAKVGNRREGIHVDCLSAAQVGGTTRAERNLISGNEVGVLLCEQATGTTILGNLIGTKADGRSALGNSDAGLQAVGTQSVTIGGMTSGASNVIAFNAIGVSLQRYLGVDPGAVRILRNSIFGNAGLGIDIARDGVTANDGAGDPDSGPNRRQNFPIVRRVTTTTSGTTIRGKIVSTPNRQYLLLFFSNTISDRQGRTYLTSKTVTTNGSGSASFLITLMKKVPVGRYVVATATDQSANDTSEYSKPRIVGN